MAWGFAFVRYKREEDVDHLLKVNLVIKVCGKRVTLARARKFGASREVGSKGKAILYQLAPSSGKLDKKTGASLKPRGEVFS